MERRMGKQLRQQSWTTWRSPRLSAADELWVHFTRDGGDGQFEQLPKA